MIRLHFKCTFLSDIVLHGTSNTEGKVEKLNYIPGSSFLGMVARAYGDFNSDAFDIFHSGKVCFSDGHIMVNSAPTLHLPYSLYAYKGVDLVEAIASNELYNHHFLAQDDYTKATTIDGKQFKQQREGFLTQEGKLAALSHNYKQKSAYDKNKRRSKDSMMYGYYSLPSGTQWAFSVTIDESMGKYKEKIKKLLCSANRLGKSKSAEYGLIKIEHMDTPVAEATHHFDPLKINGDNYLLFYAKSRLVLTDANGINCYKPSIESLGFSKEDDVKIDWNKSQIRTGRYTPYVGARANFDPERLYIDKGSVIAVKIDGQYDKDFFRKNVQKPLGLYVSEGHGEVIVNPECLLDKKVIFASKESVDVSNNNTESLNYDNTINNWLTSQRKKIEKQADLLSEVFAFINRKDNNVKHKKSQWGQIRALCRQAKDSDDLYRLLFETNNNEGFLRHGKALQKWDERLIANLEKQKNRLGNDYKRFVKLLSIYAPKEDDKGGDHEQ